MSTTYYDRIVKENIVILKDVLTNQWEDEHPKGCVKWSGSAPIPAIGDRVTVNINALGDGVVTSYFVESEPDNGYLGVKVMLDDPPDWHKKQNPGRPWALVFGAELKGDVS